MKARLLWIKVMKYWYDNGVGYCFEAVNMPSLEQESFIEMAGKYWNEGSATGEE